MRLVEVYDSLSKRDRLLEVRFELSDRPEYVRTFRSSYASLYELLERVQYHNVKREEETHNTTI